MTENKLTSLKDKLIHFQDQDLSVGQPEAWPNYVQEMDLTEDDIPELIHFATIDDEEMGYGQIFAWRALGQLRAVPAVSPLIKFLEKVALEDDCAYEEISLVLSLIGPAAKQIVQDHISNTTHSLFARIALSNYFRSLVQYYPEQREECINFLVEQLAKPAKSKDDHTLNGFFISELCTLKAIEVAKDIEQAFLDKKVDLSILGDWEDAQVYLGLKKRSDVFLRKVMSNSQALTRPKPKGFSDRSETKNTQTKNSSKSKKRKKK